MRERTTILLRRCAWVSLGATIVLIPFRYRLALVARPSGTVYHDYTDLLLFASDIALVATLAFWSAARVLSRRRLCLGPPFLSVALAALTAVCAISVVASVDPLLSLYHFVRLLLLFGLYLFVVNEVRALSIIGVAVGAQVAIQALVSIVQILGQHSMGLEALGELTLDPAWSGVSIVYADGVRSLRAYGLSDHPNILGGSLAFGLLLLALWHSESQSRWRTLIGAVFMLGAAALLLTYSRAAWLAFVAGALWCAGIFLRMRRRDALSAWSSLALASLLVVLPFAWQAAPYLGVRLGQPDATARILVEDRSQVERATVNAAANQIFAEHILFGVGVGALPEAMFLRFPELNAYYQPAHIALLDAAAETGTLGGLWYLALLLAPWLALFTNRGRLRWTPLLIGASGLLLALSVVGVFDYYTWLLAPGRLWQWLAWGLWAVAYQAAGGGPDA